MFERFTERAREVVVLAQNESRALPRDYIGTEHLLLGLLREEQGHAAAALGSFGVKIADVRERAGYIGSAAEQPGQIPFTPRAKTVCELALREALSLGHNYIGTEHILLGLLRENTGPGAMILDSLHIDQEALRDEVTRLARGPKPNSEADPWPPDEVALLLQSVRTERERLIAAQDFGWAAVLRQIESRVASYLAFLQKEAEPGAVA